MSALDILPDTQSSKVGKTEKSEAALFGSRSATGCAGVRWGSEFSQVFSKLV